MVPKQTKEVLRLHGMWLRGEYGGRKAKLRGADLQGAKLRGANLRGAKLPHFQIVPEEGQFIGWKKVNGRVLKLRIPAKAKRTSSLVGSKCRASFVTVIGGLQPGETLTNSRGAVYQLNRQTKADKWDSDIRIECTHGIHFFITKAEAEEWG